MYLRKDIDDKFNKLQAQINDIKNNHFRNLIKQKKIIIETKKNNWIEILDTNNINYEYRIMSIYIKKQHRSIHDHISSDRLRSNKIQVLYSDILQTYFIHIGNFRNDLPIIITIDYLQIPNKIDININI